MRQRSLTYAAVMAVVLALAPAAGAQRIVALTQALSAAREAAAIYLRSADLGREQVLPASERLLGNAVRGLYLWPDGHAGLAITSGPKLANIGEPVWWRGLDPSPFKIEGSMLPAPQDLAESALLKTWQQLGGSHWLARAADRGDGTSRVLFQPWNNQPVTPAAMERIVVGKYVTGTALRGPLGEVLLIVERQRGKFFAIVASMASGAPLISEFELALPQNALDPRPKIALATDSGTGYVLFGGHDLSEEGAQVASWLVAFKLSNGTSLGPPLKLFGAPQEARFALLGAGAGDCWCVTREPGRDVAYATLVYLGKDGPVKIQQYPLPGARGPVLLAQQENGDVLMAVDNRLERWPHGERGASARTFDAPIGAILWSSAGPAVASAGEIHLLDAETLDTTRQIAFNSGHVVAMREVPASSLPPDDEDGDGLDAAAERALACDPQNPDTDGDGLHDGADPEPARPTPSLDLPPMLSFNGDAAGQELHALLVRPTPDPEARWQVTYSAADIPWLRLYPTTSYGVRPVYAGLDPQFHLDPRPLIGLLRAAPMRSLQSIDDPPAREILLAVRPTRQGPLRLLWLLTEPAQAGAPGAPSFDALRDALARPPLCFSNHLGNGAPLASLDGANIVILGTQAAARGDVPQHALVDFIADGGALLVVPEAEAEGTRDVSGWFAPLGFRLAREATLSPPFTAQDTSGPAMAFPPVRGPVSGAIEATPDTLPVRASDAQTSGPLFLRQFGLGRVAAIGSAALLDPAAPGAKEFGDALFRWLARAGLDLRDLDGDGIPDQIEDANANEALDPGETDRLRADSDDDGLDDGLEDRNRNGIVDDGETDPRNPDSDGDGIFDGADRTPCLPLGAPRIGSAQPSSGPAEGGTIVTITGQGFDSSAVCFVGDRPAAVRRVPGADRLEIATPPFEGDVPGPVDLRVEMRGGEQKAILPGGFAYGPRSNVDITLAEAVPAFRHGPGFNGVLGIHFNVPPGLDIGQIVVLIEAQPGDDFTFGTPRPGPDLSNIAPAIEHQMNAGQRITITFGPNAPSPFPSGELLRIPWEYTLPTPPVGGIAIGPVHAGEDHVVAAAAVSRLGGPLDITVGTLKLHMDADTEPPAP